MMSYIRAYFQMCPVHISISHNPLLNTAALVSELNNAVEQLDVEVVRGGWLDKTLKVCRKIEVNRKFATLQIKTQLGLIVVRIDALLRV